MRRIASILALLAMVVGVGLPALAGNGNTRNFTAHLAGRNEVPSVDTQARGQAIFHVSEDGESIHYKLIVANIEEATQSHIHIAPAGVNGPVAVFLFGFVPGGVDHNGVLAEGTITEGDLIGPLAGMDIDDLVEAMSSGNAYVNVHTVANPPGEIRGQIK